MGIVQTAMILDINYHYLSTFRSMIFVVDFYMQVWSWKLLHKREGAKPWNWVVRVLWLICMQCGCKLWYLWLGPLVERFFGAGILVFFVVFGQLTACLRSTLISYFLFHILGMWRQVSYINFFMWLSVGWWIQPLQKSRGAKPRVERCVCKGGYASVGACRDACQQPQAPTHPPAAGEAGHVQIVSFMCK